MPEVQVQPDGHGNEADSEFETRRALSPTLSRLAGEGVKTPSPQSSPASGRGGERERQLSVPESLREFHVTARLHGEMMLQMPLDLYIPPDALELVLETFQGPLDLLLYLIRKHNLDVLDIPMAELTRQYLAYIELLKQHKLELAAEYLLMAAVLIEIKSRLLLPKSPRVSDDDEEDPRIELMRRLKEYEQMKLAAQQLNELPQAGRDFEIVQVLIEQTFEARQPQISVDDLKQAWMGLLARAKLNTHHTVRREQLSVREQMAHILRCLKGGEYVAFDTLFDLEGGLPKLVVTFIAMLELAKEYLLEIQQSATFGVIYVRSCRAIDAA